MAKTVSPGVQALRKVVEDVYADARKAKAEGQAGGLVQLQVPCELAEAFDLNVMYPREPGCRHCRQPGRRDHVQGCRGLGL